MTQATRTAVLIVAGVTLQIGIATEMRTITLPTAAEGTIQAIPIVARTIVIRICPVKHIKIMKRREGPFLNRTKQRQE